MRLMNSFIPTASFYLSLFWGDVEGEEVEESLKLGLGHTTGVPLALWERGGGEGGGGGGGNIHN